MDSFIGFAGIGTAIIASMGLAMWMEWYCLRWLMRLMPGRAGMMPASTAAEDTSAEAEFAVIEPELARAEIAAAPSAGGRAVRQEIRIGI